MQRRVTVALLSAAVLVATAAGTAHGLPTVAAAAGELASQDIATAGVGSPYYRIPALTTSTKGTLLAAYDARPTLGDLPGNLGVVLRRSTDGGTTWQTQQVVRKEAAPKGFGDPSLLTDTTTGRIFVFYASSVNQGFFGSATGNDESDPNVLQADYSYSDDDGLTWTHRRITQQIKNSAWAGMFAASGQGIQLRNGPYKGRLVQQYAIRNNGANYAVSAYSDDHGDTWKMGNPVGPGGDENKTVELDDGRIMLNNRSAPYRTIAYSSDGGVNYTPFTQDTNLPDPANNGSVIRYAPDATASDPQSSWLLFSNTESTFSRSNLTVKMSCDNGKTWPIRKVVEPGSAAYSTLTRLPDGRVGLLYERGNVQAITYSSFDLKWLGGTCADITITPPATLKAGTSTEVTVRVVNRMDVTRGAGTLDLTVPGGWTTKQVAFPATRPGEGANIKVPVTIPAGASGNAELTVTYKADGKQASGTRTVTVTP
ncbi:MULTISPECIES: sialidase family protein [Streptomyces]|uniref:exo-alpha-sialidase n=2 Tax=Streptomyces TaxID=1883 RepID=A0ABU2RUH1_9ACTN|nr:MULTISPECIES: sialidase family protein [unclassified Streptomyces]MBK3594713.1 exo-alpha-sialidase [Streptomyces sp. MBT51]MDT0431218.1 exo-alpha-sialidase [Streptomyces sp. DSM 41770]